MSGAASLSQAEQQVFKVVDSYLDFPTAGLKLPVSGFVVRLEHNGIPSVRISTVPKRYQAATTSSDGSAEVFNLTSCMLAYNALQEMIAKEGKRECNFYFKAISAGGEVQVLALSKWLLTGAGFGGLGASGGVQLTVEIQHPIRKINECSINFYGVRTADSAIEKFRALQGSMENLRGGIIEALRAYKTGVEAGSLTSLLGETDREEMFAKFDIALQGLEAHTEWEGAPWPTALAQEVEDEVILSLFNYAEAMNSRTVWDWLIGYVLPQWFACLIPTFWQPELTMTPYEPWGYSKVTIAAADVTDFTMPPADKLPVCGAYCPLTHPYYGTYSFLNSVDGMQLNLTDGAVWAEPTLKGAIDALRPPDWFAAALLASSAVTTQADQPGETPQNANLPGVAGTNVARLGLVNVVPFVDLKETLKGFCAEYFLENYRRGLDIVINTRLLISSPGSQLPQHYLTPGYVYTFKDVLGKASLEFFATVIEHRVDCMTRTAQTQIIGAYLREGAGLNLKTIKDGYAPNMLYTTNAFAALSAETAGAPGTTGGAAIDEIEGTDFSHLPDDAV